MVKRGEGLSRRDFIKLSAATSSLISVASVARPGISAAAQVATQVQQTGLEDAFAARTIRMRVNGKEYRAIVYPHDTLVNVLREQLGLIATKRPCNRGECGGCTVLVTGVPVLSCTYLAVRADGKEILTAEGRDFDPVLKTLQDAWVEKDASQCGYCQPGMLMSATALLKKNPNPTVSDIKLAMSGNLCRCGTYVNVIEAIQLAASRLRGGGS
ncbi:MAG: 2Fe-2S iron-sulfur cluster-binding protein [Candidatus Caldarchaeum sp.]